MTLTLELDTSLTARLRSEARRRGTTESAIVEELLRAKLPAPASLADVVEEWLVEDQTSDAAELDRREKDLAALKEGLNAAHSSDRKLFP
jgi:predicted transcriptional regulator